MEASKQDLEAACASYRQLAEIYHDLLSADGVEPLLRRLVQTVRQLIPVSSILIAESNLAERVLTPLVAEGEWPDGFLETQLPFGVGLIGVAAERGRPILSNEAHLDVRAGHVAGTPEGEPEAIISVPLVARGMVIGAMSLYREGDAGTFSPFEYELAQHFADAATLALENARIRTDLSDLAVRDELTGVFNRRGFVNQVTQACRAGAPLSVLIVDLDGFKQINDEHGHPCGDHLLRHVTSVLQTVVRASDDICRLGGDEFAVILNGADEKQARQACERVSAAVAATPTRYAGQPIEVSASVGFAVADQTTDLETLLHAADASLYEVKASKASPLRLIKGTSAAQTG